MMIVKENVELELCVEEKNILLALVYFDIFHYPLTKTEITDFAPEALSGDIQYFLRSLQAKGLIFRFDHFYTLHNSVTSIERRRAGNALALERMTQARKFSKIISSFPFVRGVMLSGSMSKNYMDAKSDIDYFIITEKGRLWMVRVALVLFRRFFLLNSRKYFCTNYFIDSAHLEIEEKNLFTSVEVATLKPMFGKKVISQFHLANQWFHIFLPNGKPECCVEEDSPSLFKSMLESVLSRPLFDRLEQWLMKRSVLHFKKSYRHLLNESDFKIAFQSEEGASRSHPNFFQKRVLSSYEHKIAELERSHGINLSI